MGISSSARSVIEALEPRRLMAADMVVQWNNVLMDAIRHDTTQPGPTWGSRNPAMVQLAVYDAVNGIVGGYKPYLVHRKAIPRASADAAAAQAAHDELVNLYPNQKESFDTALKASLDEIPKGPEKNKGRAWGRFVALKLWHERRKDGSDDNTAYTVGTDAGEWQPDPMNPGQKALGPNWGKVKPFAMDSGQQFRPPAPPEMTSQAYTDAFNEVKDLGALNSATRTEEQTLIGNFWAYDRGGMGPPPIMYNQCLQAIAALEGNTMAQNARLFALANMAMADAGIAAWDCKYTYNFWRPITAIRNADLDGNPDTVADPNWVPLGAPGDGVVADFTPPFPAYISGHSTFGAAVFRTLADFYGTDDVSFTLHSDELPGVMRPYSTFSQAAEENGVSRIYLGIHWSFDNTYGQQTGNAVADFISRTQLTAVPPKPHGGHGSPFAEVMPIRPGGDYVSDSIADDDDRGDDLLLDASIALFA